MLSDAYNPDLNIERISEDLYKVQGMAAGEEIR